MAKGKRHATRGGWRQIAPLVPLALFASAFTVSATDNSAVATASLETESPSTMKLLDAGTEGVGYMLKDRLLRPALVGVAKKG